MNLDDKSVVSVPMSVNDWPDDFMNVDTDDNLEHKPRIVQVTNFQEADDVSSRDFNYSTLPIEQIKTEVDTDDDGQEYSQKHLCEKSLFTRSIRRRLPWEADATNIGDYADQDEDIVPMTEYEENEMLEKLKLIITNGTIDIPTWVSQFYRKLCLRELKRSLAQPIFDIDNLTCSKLNGNGQILDRYHLLIGSAGQKRTFYSTLAGSMEYEMFVSPHTGRVLHPFIYRNSKSMPMWVKVSV